MSSVCPVSLVCDKLENLAVPSVLPGSIIGDFCKNYQEQKFASIDFTSVEKLSYDCG